VTDPDEPQSRSGVDSGAEAPISEADAEDEVAQAESRAEAARARLERLRRTAETTDDDAVPDDGEQHPGKLSRWRRRWLRRPARPRWLRRPTRKAVAVGVGIVLASASLGASGYMVWQHRIMVHKRQLVAEFTAAARQDVTVLMSIDANHAKDDFQRIIDDSTGDFKSQLSAMSGLLAKQTAESKVSGKATVEAVAVESMSDNSGVVLVAARLDVTDADNTHRPPVVSRISVGLTRDGGQLRMSKVDFLQ
jgi:Mce-associated membrane protein